MEKLEFGGRFGAPFMILGLPLAVYILNLACNPSKCRVTEIPEIPTDVSNYLSYEAVFIFLAWLLFHCFIAILPIGDIKEGLLLADGRRLKYRCNGFQALVLSLLCFAVLLYIGVPVSRVYDNFLQLATTAIVFSTLLAVYLYTRSYFVRKEELATGGNTGFVLYDFFIGRELNPRLGPLDLKFFCEMRPGLIGWVMFDLCFMVRSYETFGEVPPTLVLVTVFHTWYVADALWYEEAILTTMDIVHDGFGFMLAFGDLAWVPFLYSLQARFLLEHPQKWSLLTLLCIFLLHCLGYFIFRGSNSQKNDFRQNPDNPNLKHLETMSTSSGRKLLVSGWWGLCRHPNYLGDLLMSLSWSLPSGPYHLLPFFYPVYFLILLVHRSLRDDATCNRKYGHDWQKYCQRVKYVIFPYIY